MREPVENAIDDLGLVGIKKRMRHINIFVDDDTGGHIGTFHQFERS